MSWNYTAYFLDAWALLLTEGVIVLYVYAAHTCSFNYKSDYNKKSKDHIPTTNAKITIIKMI